MASFLGEKVKNMKQWTMKSDKDAQGKPIDFAAFGRQFGVSPVLARLLVNRHLNTADKVNQYLFGGLSHLENPYFLKDVEKAAELLKEAGGKNLHIRIIGDYDVDGIMSVYILKEGLRICGIEADYQIPHRILHGYGLNPVLVEEAYKDGVQILLTCDNGISAKEAVGYANLLGMQVIVTDHHEVPYEIMADGSRHYLLPPAAAVVNAKQAGCRYPMKEICGAYTAFRLVQVLYDHCMGTKMEHGVAENLLPLVGFAALATVCDVMELTGENRILVKEGLRLLPETENPGMQALIRASGLEGRILNSYHFGFILGPCLNSAGRLHSAEDALELFFMEDEIKLAERAGQLVSLNQQRKQMTQDGTDQAADLVEKQRLKQGKIDDVLVLYLPECHESIAGIVAAKVKELYYRPVFVLTDPAEGSALSGKGMVKGSGRSIPPYSMYEKLSECREYLYKFGGHPMAAGLSLKKEDIGAFRKFLNERSGLSERDFVERIAADMMMPFSGLSLPLVEELSLLQPFGNGNEDPLFGLVDVQILSARYMGKDNRFLRLVLTDASGQRFDAPLFSGVEEFTEQLCGNYGSDAMERLLNGIGYHYRMNILYYPEINEFNGRVNIQIRLVDFQF